MWGPSIFTHQVLHVAWFASWSAGVWVWHMQISSWEFVGWTWMWSTMSSGVVSWRTSMCGWSVQWGWCGVLHGRTNGCNLYMWSMSIMLGTPEVAVIIPMSWTGATFVWVIMTWAAMSVKMRLWSGTTLPVPVFMVVSWTWSIGVAFVRSGLVMFCWGSWRRYPMWTIHDNVAILITFKTPNVGATSCYVSLFLTLETAWSSSLYIMLNVDGGIIMVVSCCTALSFSTSDIAWLSVCGPFS